MNSTTKTFYTCYTESLFLRYKKISKKAFKLGTLECLIDVPLLANLFFDLFPPRTFLFQPLTPAPINYGGKFPTQKRFLKQYTYADFFGISQKEWPRLYCVFFCKFV